MHYVLAALMLFIGACIDTSRQEGFHQMDSFSLDIVEQEEDVPISSEVETEVREHPDIWVWMPISECDVFESDSCDDGDRCTIDTCVGGKCRNRSIECGDGLFCLASPQEVVTDTGCIECTSNEGCVNGLNGICNTFGFCDYDEPAHTHEVAIRVEAPMPGIAHVYYGNFDFTGEMPFEVRFTVEDACVAPIEIWVTDIDPDPLDGVNPPFWGCDAAATVPSKDIVMVSVNGEEVPALYTTWPWVCDLDGDGDSDGEGNRLVLPSYMGCEEE